jgi:hypothetical protein
MSVRGAIQSLGAFLEASPVIWRTPELAQVSQNMTQRAAQIRPPLEHVDYATLHTRFLRATEANDWEGLDLADWNNVTYVMWLREPSLAAISRFQSSYRRFLEASRTARPFKRLIYAYLEAYDPAREGIAWAGALIRKIVLQKRHFILDYWRKMDLELEIFSTTPGPVSLAQHCLDHPTSALAPTQELGLNGTLAHTGYAHWAYLAAGRLVAENIKSSTGISPARLTRFVEWSCGDQGVFLRFPALRQTTFDILLAMPTPSEDVRVILGQFFTRYAEAWRRGDVTCPEPTRAEIEAIGRLL